MKSYIVIGANYGDEGKGLTTQRICESLDNKDTMVILHNGGAQRGHTINGNKGRHVCSHFGSNCLLSDNPIMLFTKDYIINPLIFCNELRQIKSLNPNFYPTIYVDPDCKITTIYEMIGNQSKSTSQEKHNTCGAGIWETQIRDYSFTYKDLYKIKSNPSLLSNLTNSILGIAKDNMYRSIQKENISIANNPFSKYYDLNYSYKTLQDLNLLLQYTTLFTPSILTKYNNLVFENGQGMMIDQNIDIEYGTPSNTILDNPISFLNKYNLNGDISVNWVSRTYQTRHGDGEFKGESNLNFKETTNLTNDNQGRFRYRNINFDNLIKRTSDSISKIPNNFKVTNNLMVTHCDILPINNNDLINLTYGFDGIELCNNEFGKDIVSIK